MHIIPARTGELVQWRDWMWRELREGGLLQEYLRREKARSGERVRKVARQMHGRRQRSDIDLRLLAAVPAREFFRWKQEDPDFWRDDANLKSLKRDNPEMAIFV